MEHSVIAERAIAAQEGLVVAAYEPDRAKLQGLESLDDAIANCDDFEQMLYFMQEKTHKGDVTAPAASSSSTALPSSNSEDANDELKYKQLANEIRSGAAHKTKRRRQRQGKLVTQLNLGGGIDDRGEVNVVRM